ncbi:auxilin-related protein 1-like [Daucus carota subsp. sativus]|uniref:auxilin-related protein 1-like n=1 Tax=Daucus carota subsp. sativus TaxID=79200 RepID=UPI0030834A0E
MMSQRDVDLNCNKRLAESLDAEFKRWSIGKEGNLRALLSTLQYILGPGSDWQPISLTDIIMSDAVKKAYRKATLHVHPDKLQQQGASIREKYICEKSFSRSCYFSPNASQSNINL